MSGDACLGRDLRELLDALLNGAHNVVGGLADQRAEILGLSHAGLQAAAPVLGRDVERLDRRLGGEKVAHRGKTRVGIFLCDLEQLEAGLGSALAGLIELAVQLFRRGLGGLADLFKALGRLADASLGELARDRESLRGRE